MTLDIGPFLETVAPLSVLCATAFGIGRVLYKQDDHGKKLDKLVLEVRSLADKHQQLERKVYDDDMYERGLEDARARARILTSRSRSRARRSRR